MFLKIIYKILPDPISQALKRVYRSYSNKLVKGLLVRGKNVSVLGNCEFEKMVNAGSNIDFSNCKIGRYSYFNGNNTIQNCKIGRYCSIADGVRIGLKPHPVENIISTHPFFYKKATSDKFFKHSYADKKYFDVEFITEIGNDVWIGTNVLIKSGVKIGDGSVIGAGAVVTKNIEPYAIVAGVPAKLIRYRFTKAQIKFLLNFKWWDKPEDWLKVNWEDLLDIRGLVEKY